MSPDKSKLLSLRGIELRYLQMQESVLEDVDMDIPAGQILALVGENGVGKTTLLRGVSGLLKPRSGTIEVSSTLLSPSNALDMQKTGVLIENPGIYSAYTIGEYLDFFGGFYHNFSKNIQTELLEGFDLTRKAKLTQISMGTLQKVQLVRVLQYNPELLLLDEPVASLDPRSRKFFWDFVQKRASLGVGVVISSHILEELEQHCHQAVVLENKTARILSVSDEDALHWCIKPVEVPQTKPNIHGLEWFENSFGFGWLLSREKKLSYYIEELESIGIEIESISSNKVNGLNNGLSRHFYQQVPS